MTVDLRDRAALSSASRLIATAGICIAAIVGSVFAGQKTSGSPPVQPSDIPIRAAQLQDRLDRQMKAGLVDAAERTERELDQLTREQNSACRDYWSPEGVPVPKPGLLNTGKKLEEYQKRIIELTQRCTWRPGQTPVQSPEQASSIRMSVVAEGLVRRMPLFAEPALTTRTDADVPNPLLGFVDFREATASGTAAQPSRRRFETTFSRDLIAMGGRLAFGDLAEAKAAYERELAGFDGPPGSPVAMVALEALRGINERLGDNAEALRIVGVQIAALESRFGLESPALCHVLWSAIPLFLANAQGDNATQAATRCLQLVDSRGPASLTRASALNNLGVVHHRLGALKQALEAYTRSLAILERAPAPASTLVLADNLAEIVDRYASDSSDPPLANVHANLALASWQLGDIAQATRHARIAREQMRGEGRNGSERGVVESMARLAVELDAVLALERAVERSGGSPSPLALPLLLERKSIALDVKAVAVRNLGSDPGQLQNYRALLARRSMLARGAPRSADERRAWNGEAAEIDLQILGIETLARHWSQNMAAYREAISIDPRERAYLEAFSEAFQKHHDRLMRNVRDLEGIAAADAEARRLATAEIAPKFRDFLETGQREQRGDRERLLPRVQASLSKTAVLLEFVRFRPLDVHAPINATARFGPARYGAYVVRQAGTAAFIDFGEAAPIDDLVVELRRSLAQPRGTLAHDLGRRLDDALMRPVRERLAGASVIHVSPDGLLNLVPFGALVDEQDRYLLERYTFNYVSSGRDLIRNPSVAPASVGPAAVIADPDFDPPNSSAADVRGGAAPESVVASRGAVSSRFERLPGTAAEATAIKSILADAAVYTGPTATETLMKAMSVPRILHVATHGFFLADQDVSATGTEAEDPMLRSGLVFASVNTRQSGLDDGILTALEAAGLDLAGTRLVVLSACETGVGDVKTGEGVFGLRRAFKAAGAETLVMSLWQVEDNATQRLMVEFYRRLARGEPRAEALRQASLTLLRDPAYRHPFYWASFISSGETGPMGR